MRALREQDYDEMAGRVVGRFLDGGVKMADAAVEEAVQGQLNADQIERLVQAANTMAFLRMMEARKADGERDMTHEFEPLETRSVIKSIIDAGPNLDQPAPDGHGASPIGGDDAPLPDEMGKRRRAQGPESMPGVSDAPDGPFPKGERQKAQERSDDKKPPAKAQDKDVRKEAMVRGNRLAKLASVFDDQLIAAEMAFDDGYGRLARLFKLAHGAPRFEDFEKDAMSVEGDQHGLAVINLMRRDRGLPLRGPDAVEKAAQLRDRRVVDDTQSIREFRALVKISRQAARVRDGALHVRSLCS
jgi:hypothetical protein